MAAEARGSRGSYGESSRKSCARREGEEPDAEGQQAKGHFSTGNYGKMLLNDGKMLLVFGCIGSDFCKNICVLQHFSKSTRFSSWNFWNLTKFCKFFDICKIFAEFSQKLLIFKTDFLRKFWDCSGAKVCKSCRAWKMLSNAYFLAKFRFDTAENEPFAKFCKICQFCWP